MSEPDAIPASIRFEVLGIKTRSHDKPTKVYSYLVYVEALRCWMPVRDALRNGVVPFPPDLPGISSSPQRLTAMPTTNAPTNSGATTNKETDHEHNGPDHQRRFSL